MLATYNFLITGPSCDSSMMNMPAPLYPAHVPGPLVIARPLESRDGSGLWFQPCCSGIDSRLPAKTPAGVQALLLIRATRPARRAHLAATTAIPASSGFRARVCICGAG